MKSMMSKLKYPLAILFLILSSFTVTAGWFTWNHYYHILGNDLDLVCKGEPYQKNGFTIFYVYPTGEEMKVKASLIETITDTGTLSPEQIKTQGVEKTYTKLKPQLAVLFATNSTTKYPHLTPESLAEAEKLGADDEVVWKYFIDTDKRGNFLKAKNSNIPLLVIAERIGKMEKLPSSSGERRPLSLECFEVLAMPYHVFDKVEDKK